MDDLIRKLEAATGPDRSLDEAIFVIAKYEPSEKLPAYTASIDAALTLVPEGWLRYVADDENGVHACVWQKRMPWQGGKIQAGCLKAATPAIALCIAALKARAQTTTAT